MDHFSRLLDAHTETEFFILLFNLLKSRNQGPAFEMEAGDYLDEQALYLPVRQIVIRPNERGGLSFGAEETHTFILTQSQQLFWHSHGETEQVVVGLVSIQARLGQISQDTPGSVLVSARTLDNRELPAATTA